MTRAERVAAFRRPLGEHILVLDGAMSTMIQSPELSATDDRGSRVHDGPNDLRNNDDLLTLTRPQLIRDVHGPFLLAAARATA